MEHQTWSARAQKHVPVHKLANDTNSTRLSSWDSDTTVIEHKQNDVHKLKKYSGRELIYKQKQDDDIPPMQTSISVPTRNTQAFPNMRRVHINYIHSRANNPNLIAPSHAMSSGDLTPSRKGLRRNPKPLPKPLPNRSNNRFRDNHDDNNEEQLPLTQQQEHEHEHDDIDRDNMNMIVTKRYMNAQTMAYRMTMHHQSHQRTLQGRHKHNNENVIARHSSSLSPPPQSQPQPHPHNNAQHYPPPIVREDAVLSRKTAKYHRHSEPHIPSTFDGPFSPPSNISNFKINYRHRRNIIRTNDNNAMDSYKSSSSHISEHHPSPSLSPGPAPGPGLGIHGVRGHITYPDSPGQSPPIAYAAENDALSSSPVTYEERPRTRSSNSRIRSKSHPAKPPKVEY